MLPFSERCVVVWLVAAAMVRAGGSGGRCLRQDQTLVKCLEGSEAEHNRQPKAGFPRLGCLQRGEVIGVAWRWMVVHVDIAIIVPVQGLDGEILAVVRGAVERMQAQSGVRRGSEDHCQKKGQNAGCEPKSLSPCSHTSHRCPAEGHAACLVPCSARQAGERSGALLSTPRRSHGRQRRHAASGCFRFPRRSRGRRLTAKAPQARQAVPQSRPSAPSRRRNGRPWQWAARPLPPPPSAPRRHRSCRR